MTNKLTIPEQAQRFIDGQRCDYFYDRSRKILVAAYPEMWKHFEKGYLYIGDVVVVPSNQTNEPLKGLWLDVQTPQSLSNKKYGWDRKCFRLRGKTINLLALRKAIVERQRFHDEQHAKWDAAEKIVIVYEIALTPAEAKYLAIDSKSRCSCGHLNSLHEYQEDDWFCPIIGCECKEKSI